jgi:L-malate glycosyltransferase
MAASITPEVKRHHADAGNRTLPVRVVLVGPSLRTLLGGQEVQLDLLYREWLGDASVEASLVFNNPELPKGLCWVEHVPGLRTLVRFPFYVASLWHETKHAEIVHVFSASHSSFLLAPVPACVVARLLKKKTLIHYHSRRAREHLTDSALARSILQRTDSVVVPSTYLADVFAQFGIDATIVPNTINLTQFSYRPRIPLRSSLLCTRNFDDYCGVDLVVRAFRRIKDAVPGARLRLVGKGKQERWIRALISELRLDDVEFLGPVPRDRIGEIYATSDICINASRGDNMPVSILEAFASGLPVATTAAGGIPHMLKHEVTGLLCEVGDWQGLADNVIRLLGDNELALALAQHAHETVKQYTWAAVRERWLEVYRPLITRNQRGSGYLITTARAPLSPPPRDCTSNEVPRADESCELDSRPSGE